MYNSVTQKNKELQRRRIWAQIIDLVFMFLLFIMSLLLIHGVQRLTGLEAIKEGNLYYLKIAINILILLAMFVLFFGYFPSFKGQTIGKIIMGIRIRPKQGTGVRTFGRMLFREVILKYLLMLTGIGLLCNVILFFIPCKNPIYDTITCSEVVFIKY